MRALHGDQPRLLPGVGEAPRVRRAPHEHQPVDVHQLAGGQLQAGHGARGVRRRRRCRSVVPASSSSAARRGVVAVVGRRGRGRRPRRPARAGRTTRSPASPRRRTPGRSRRPAPRRRSPRPGRTPRRPGRPRPRGRRRPAPRDSASTSTAAPAYGGWSTRETRARPPSIRSAEDGVGVPGARVVAGGHLHDHPGHARAACAPPRSWRRSPRARRSPSAPLSRARAAPRSTTLVSPSLLADQHEAGQLAQAAGDQRVEDLVEAGAVVDQLPQRRPPGPSRAGGRSTVALVAEDAEPVAGPVGPRAPCAARRSWRAPSFAPDSRAAARSRRRSRRHPTTSTTTAVALSRPPAATAAATSSVGGVPRVAPPGRGSRAIRASSIIPVTPSEQSSSRSARGDRQQEVVGVEPFGPAEGAGDHVPLGVGGGLAGGDRARRRRAPAPGCGRR